MRENVSTTPGREVFRFVPARLLEQGQVVYYTVRITNPTTVPLRNVAVVQPVPANTRICADSAAGPGAAVSFSVDGGVNFAPAQSLTIELDGRSSPRRLSRYTHIRWQLRNPLAPGAIALARFRATFQLGASCTTTTRSVRMPKGRWRRRSPASRRATSRSRWPSRSALALRSHGRLIVEAGTGTGKTFAYLVPALLSGRRVIVSTGTRNLQDQLFHRDLPTVARRSAVRCASRC